MSLRSRISHAWSALTAEGKAAPAGYYGSGWAGGPAYVDAFRARRAPSPPELVEAFKSVCYTCAYLNANGVARVPLRLYATTGRGQARPKSYVRAVSSKAMGHLRSVPSYAKAMTSAVEVEEVAEHPLLEAMAEVNADFDTNLLMVYTVLCMDIAGAAYWVPEEGTLGVPTGIWPLQGQYVIPTRLSNTANVDFFQYFDTRYMPDQLVRFRHVSMKDPYGPGYGPTQAAFEQLGLGDKYMTVQEQLLGSGVRPSVIISAKDQTSFPGRDEARRYEAEVNARYSGQGAGKAWFVDAAVDVHNLTFPPSELADLEINKHAMNRAANCFGVPISLLQTEDVNLANAEAGHRQHAEMGIEPRCIRIASGLTKWTRTLGQRKGNQKLGWDRLFWAFDSAVAEDVERKAKVFDMEIKNGKRSINECRLEDGQPAAPWGDEPWFSNTLVQPSAAPTLGPDGKPLPVAEGETPAEGVKSAAVDNVQSTALNGAQIASLLEIVQEVVAGQIPPETGRALIEAAFPSLSAEEIESILGPALSFKPKPDPNAAPPPGAGKPPGKPEPDDDTKALVAESRELMARVKASFPEVPR